MLRVESILVGNLATQSLQVRAGWMRGKRALAAKRGFPESPINSFIEEFNSGIFFELCKDPKHGSRLLGSRLKLKGDLPLVTRATFLGCCIPYCRPRRTAASLRLPDLWRDPLQYSARVPEGTRQACRWHAVHQGLSKGKEVRGCTSASTCLPVSSTCGCGSPRTWR